MIKKILQPMTLLMISAMILSSCTKEDPAIQMRKDAEVKILGQWKTTRIMNQVYFPITVLKTDTEYPGTKEDYYLFTDNGLVEINSSLTGKRVVPYQVFNPFTVLLGEEVWRIIEHSQSRLVLLRDVNEVDQDKRFVTKFFLEK